MADHNFPSPKEVAEILSTEPEYDLSTLTAEEKPIALKLIPLVVGRVRETVRVDLEAKKARELEQHIQSLSAQNAEMMEKEITKLKESNKPPSPEDLSKLLSQEYAEMTVRLVVRDGSGRKERTFVIRELPQSIEMRLFKSIFDLLLPNVKKLSAANFAPGSSTEQKVQQVVDMLPEAMTLMSDLCATCLDPYGDEKINGDWVRMNMSSARIRDVLEAQVAVGRIRDFFSQAVRIVPEYLTQ